jgi:hypothetical protein
LKNPFIWPQNRSNESKERNIVEQHESQYAIDFSQVEEREMYIGSRRSHAWHEAMKDLYGDLIKDIKEGCMIVVLVIEDPHGYPFWNLD